MNLQVAEYIRSLVPYVPGKPIEETQREFKLKRVIKLASNENPLGPSPKAVKALKEAATELHRYPDGSGFHLKAALSKFLKISPTELILGNGSNEVIDHLVRTYCVPGDAIVTSQAAFIAYRIAAQIHGVTTTEVPVGPDLKFDLGQFAETVRKNARVRIAFIANPNNPTGTYTTEQELKTLLGELMKIRGGSVLVVLDSAYWEYVTAKDLPDPLSLRSLYPNLVVLRTFSKVYGLAGLRIGYGISTPEIISNLEKVRLPFNMNSLGLVGAEAALTDTAFVTKSRQLNAQGIKFWEKELTKQGIPFWKSQGNFILVNVKEGLGQSGKGVYQDCLAKGVIFRPLANYGLPDALRITVGTPEENEKAFQVLTQKRRKK